LKRSWGFRLQGRTLRVEPCIPASWPGFELTIAIGLRRTAFSSTTRLVKVAASGQSTWTGSCCRTTSYPSATMAKSHTVRVRLG
jgi:cellobiose phosphorylase